MSSRFWLVQTFSIRKCVLRVRTADYIAVQWCIVWCTAACLLVCIEIFEGSLGYAQGSLPQVYPPETLSRAYGYSFGLGWCSFALFLLAGVVLLIYSRKEKDTEKDQPVILGRLWTDYQFDSAVKPILPTVRCDLAGKFGCELWQFSLCQRCL